jgi:hypothetical protein
MTLEEIKQYLSTTTDEELSAFLAPTFKRVFCDTTFTIDDFDIWSASFDGYPDELHVQARCSDGNVLELPLEHVINAIRKIKVSRI